MVYNGKMFDKGNKMMHIIVGVNDESFISKAV